MLIVASDKKLSGPVRQSLLFPPRWWLINVSIELDREADGRWIAEVPALPGVIVYGSTRSEAVAKAKALALPVIADRIEHGEETGELVSLTFKAA